MTIPRTLALLALGLAVLAFAACGGETPSKGGDADDHASHEDKDGHDDHGHDHDEGPHGGAIVLLGDHAWHLEVVHHPDEQALEVYAYDADMEPAEMDGAPKVNLAGPAGKVSLTAEAMDDGGWRFVHESLAGEPERGRFQVVLGGTTYVPDLPEHHHGEDGDHEGHAHD